MNDSVDTVLIIHTPTEWRSTNYRFAFRDLSDALPPNVAVLCVNRPVDLVVALLKHPRKFLTQIWWTRTERAGDRLHVVTPRLLVHERFAARVGGLSRINRRALHRQVTRVLDRWFPKTTRLIQWIHHPAQSWVYQVFPEAGRVYLCYDEYSRSWDGRFNAAAWESERRLLADVDVTFVTSDTLLRRRRGLTRRLEMMPNGVPEFLFDPPQGSDAMLRSVPRPRLAYLGNVRNTLDYALLERVFTHRRDWQMVFIGPVESEASVRRLRRLPNVHFLGPCPHEDLAAILSGVDVGLIPFQINEFTHAIHPHKLFEYMAVGVPVVATDLEALRRFQPLVRLCPAEAEPFERAIEEALAGDRDGLAVRLRDAARDYTWPRISREHIIPVLQDVFGF